MNFNNINKEQNDNQDNSNLMRNLNEQIDDMKMINIKPKEDKKEDNKKLKY